MTRYKLLLAFYSAVCWGFSSANATQEGLTLGKAVSLALSADDPSVALANEKAAALDARAVADSQLSDPKFRVSAANLPTDGFSFTQEPMTQLQVGVTQAFPRGNVRQLTRQRRYHQADTLRRIASLRHREIILQVRHRWLDLRYLHAAEQSVNRSKTAVTELVEVVQATFATGSNKSQDIFRAQMELGLLDDRMLEIAHKQDKATADLRRWIGEAAGAQPVGVPGLRHPSALVVIRGRLPMHPAMAAEAARISAATEDVAIAQEGYKPGWAISAGFGRRAGGRADFATVGVTMDVPLFTGKRQDKRLSAAKRMREAARLQQQSVLLELHRRLDTVYADWERSGERISLYRGVVQARARDTAEASLTSYQTGVTDFPELVRSRLALLEAELKLLMLERDKLKAQAALLFLEGEDDA